MKGKAFTKNKNLAYIALGHWAFLILSFAAIYFYKERILFADSAFQFFKIVNFEKINVEASRYGAILPEFPLLLAIKLGLSLKMLTIIYSVSFILLYYIIFLACIYLLKNTSAGLSIVLVLIVCISQSFFHPSTETHQALVFSVLVYAILQYPFRNSFIQFLLAVFTIVVSFLAHPVALYPLAFIIGYSAICKRQLRSVKPYILLFLLVGLALLKVLLTNENSYEGQFFSELFKSPLSFINIFKFYSTKFFLKRIFGLYLWLTILECILIIFLLIKKGYLKLFWQLGTLGFFMLITLITYNKGDSDMMMERAFMPLSLFVSLPFLKEIIDDYNKNRLLKFIFLSVIIVFSFNRIYSQGKVFWERTRFNQQLLAKTAQLPNRKFIVATGELQRYHHIYWSYSFETLILSTITAGIPTQTIFPANDVNSLVKYTEGNSDIFLGADFWLEWSINNLNHKYFNLSAELPYAVIKTSEL